MTSEQILELAKQCDMQLMNVAHGVYEVDMEDLIAFANAIAQRTRDECAAACVASKLIEWPTTTEISAVNKCAKAIRSMTNECI